MSEPKRDANGWLRVSEVKPPYPARVMYYYPPAGKGYPAFVSITTSFVSEYDWRKPTHWQPEPAGPVGSSKSVQLSMLGERL